MKGLLKVIGIVLLATMVVSFSGCRLFGDDDEDDYTVAGTNQLAIRNAVAPAVNVRADLRAAAVGAPTTSTVALYLGTTLVSGPHTMGTGGYLFTGLADGNYIVRLTIGTKVFQTTKTLSGTVPALALKVSYLAETGSSDGIQFETFIDTDKDGQVGGTEASNKKELSEGSTDANDVDDPLDVTASTTAELDKDGDGVPNMFDGDVDGDGQLNGVDADIDGDGKTNDSPDEADADGDGVANGDDRDTDGDGKLNGSTEETDTDGDGTSDATDSDTDGDGTPNSIDTQPGGDGTTTTTPTTPTTPTPVTNADFPTPTGFATAGFPGTTSTLTVTGFASPKKSGLVLVNTSKTAVTGSVSSANVAANVLGPRANLAQETLTKSQQFHKWLREFGRTLPPMVPTPSLRKVIAPPAVGDAFSYVIAGSGTSYPTKIVSISAMPANGNLIHWVSDSITGTQLTDVTARIGEINTLWNTANTGIYAKVREIFGDEPPAGSFNSLTLDGNINVVWLPPSTDNTAGFFYSGDLYAKANISGGISNERKVFYMHIADGSTADDYASTFAHEFQHMINFYQHKLNNIEEESWLDEAMAGYAEHVTGFSIAGGKNASKATQVNEFFKLVHTNSLPVWSGGHADYGQVYMFGLWLAEKYGTNGSVKTLLSQTKVGAEGVAAFSGKTFETVISQWLLALYVNDNTGATKYGYTGFDLKGTNSAVLLTGPLATSGSITVQPYTAAFVEVTGPAAASTLTWTVPTTLSVFEMNK